MTCVSFQRSIDILCLPECNAYGVQTGNELTCTEPWPVCDREAWIHALAAAEAEISNDLGVPLCPQEICDELHLAKCNTRLIYRPVAYIGVKVFSAPEVLPITWTPAPPETPTHGSVLICPVDTEIINLDNVVFSYVSDACYNGAQTLQEPCLEWVDDCDGLGGVGIRATWERCQLADPTLDLIEIDNDDHFISEVQWQYWTIDEDQAIEVVGECDCEACNVCTVVDFDVTVNSLELGEICIEPSSCGCTRRRVLVNYATAFNCGRGIDPALEKAVVLYALVMLGKDKPCGCDVFKEKLNWWLSLDETATQAFAKDLIYGPTRAGMMVWRTIIKLKKRMVFDQSRGRGGHLNPRHVRGLRSLGKVATRGIY